MKDKLRETCAEVRGVGNGMLIAAALLLNTLWLLPDVPPSVVGVGLLWGGSYHRYYAKKEEAKL